MNFARTSYPLSCNYTCFDFVEHGLIVHVTGYIVLAAKTDSLSHHLALWCTLYAYVCEYTFCRRFAYDFCCIL